MRKGFIVFIILLLVLSINPRLFAQNNSLNITVDPRIELLAAVQILSDYNERFGILTRFDFPYKDDMLEYFAPYKEHDAVKMFSEMSAKAYSFDAPPAAMLYLSNPPELNVTVPFTDYLKGRAGGETTLNSFVAALRKFAEETHFIAFYEAHRGTFKRITSDVKKAMGEIDYIATLESYYGMKQHSFTIVLAPIFHAGGFGPRVQREGSTFDIYNICGSQNVDNGFPIFGTTNSFQHLAWHEFSHSFVNPATESFSDEVNKYETLYEPIAQTMQEQAYSTWSTCVNEHIVRAITTRLMYREIGEDEGNRALMYEKGRGFFYVEPLCLALEYYESHRDQFPTFLDFYPKLIEVFKELSEKNLGPNFYSVPFAGTINGIFNDKKSIILIAPTNESPDSTVEKIQKYVETIRNKFFKNSPIITDTEALKKELSGNTIVAYGTPQGNLWISSLLKTMPINFDATRITADSIYTGNQLRLITVWPNPQNHNKGALIYTARNAENIPGINTIFHGPTDYVIADGNKVLKSGNFNKLNPQWKLEKSR